MEISGAVRQRSSHGSRLSRLHLSQVRNLCVHLRSCPGGKLLREARIQRYNVRLIAEDQRAPVQGQSLAASTGAFLSGARTSFHSIGKLLSRISTLLCRFAGTFYVISLVLGRCGGIIAGLARDVHLILGSFGLSAHGPVLQTGKEARAGGNDQRGDADNSVGAEALPPRHWRRRYEIVLL